MWTDKEKLYHAQRALENCARWACGEYKWNKSEILWVIWAALEHINEQEAHNFWRTMKKDDTKFIQDIWHLLRNLQATVDSLGKRVERLEKQDE